LALHSFPTRRSSDLCDSLGQLTHGRSGITLELDPLGRQAVRSQRLQIPRGLSRDQSRKRIAFTRYLRVSLRVVHELQEPAGGRRSEEHTSELQSLAY